MFLSVIIPFLNESKRLPESLKIINNYLKAQSYDYEIILVDDGSTDGSGELIKEFLLFSNIHIFTHDKNKGKGAAVKTGVMNSLGNYILFLDADLSTPIEEIEKFIPVIEQGSDIVIGSRSINKELLIKKQPLYRRFIGQFGSMLIKLFLKLPFDDTQCGFKMFTRDAALFLFKKMKMQRWSFDYELLYLAQKNCYKITALPVHWKDEKKYSKFNPVIDSVRSFVDLFRIWLMHK